MKKLKITLFLILSFSGFLSLQIIWNQFYLNAKSIEPEKQKYSSYENALQTLNITTTQKQVLTFKTIKEPIIVLNFWASWCVPCLKEFPSLVEFQEKYKGRVKVIGINGDEESPIENIKKIEAKYKLNFSSVSDPESKISDQFLITSYPVSIVFLKGKVIYLSQKNHNFMSEDFRKLIDESL